jgi:type VI secretion system secreted protein Hcp
MASDYLLELEGIKGESKVLRGAVDVFSWSFGASRATTAGGGGAVKFEPLLFTKHVDKCSPTLAQSCCSGKHIPKAVLHVRKAGGGTSDYYVVTMEECLVSSFQHSSEGGGAVPTDQFSLNFAQVEVQYSTVSSGPLVPQP